MAPEINHWFKDGMVPPLGTRFRLSKEGAVEIGKRINRMRGALPKLEVKQGLDLVVPSDFNVIGSPDKIRLEYPSRLECVEVGRKEDLFDEMVLPEVSKNQESK